MNRACCDHNMWWVLKIFRNTRLEFAALIWFSRWWKLLFKGVFWKYSVKPDQVLGYLRGLTSPSLTTEDLMLQLYTSTSFLLLAMSLLVTGSTYLGESIICSLHSPIMYSDVRTRNPAWTPSWRRWSRSGWWTPTATSTPPTPWTASPPKTWRMEPFTQCKVCSLFKSYCEQASPGLGEVTPTSHITFHR